jgi:hypothetical protein
MKITPISAAVATPMSSNADEEPKVDQRIAVLAPLCALEHAWLGMAAVAGIIIHRTPKPNSDDDDDGHGERIQYLAHSILGMLDSLHEAQCSIEAAAGTVGMLTISQQQATREGHMIGSLIDAIGTATGLIVNSVPKENENDERYATDMKFLTNRLFGHSTEIEEGVLLQLLGYDRHAPDAEEVQ